MRFFRTRGSVLLAAVLALAGCGGDGADAVPPVAVSSVSPAEAKVGETITVQGQNFGASQGSSTLRINGVTATVITSWTATQIEAVVPDGASTGNVTVTVNGAVGAPGYLVVPWTAESPDNVAISVEANSQQTPQLIPDGAGGAIIVWQDSRTPATGADIYAQRVNSAGVPQWTAGGVAVSTATGNQQTPQLISDGAGGAIIVWEDLRSGNLDIYVQRINSTGVPQWAPGGNTNGIAVSAVTGIQQKPRLIPDNASGAIIVWEDYRAGATADIYAQRVNSVGAVQWAANGVAVSAAVGTTQQTPQLVTDGASGAIIVWQDNRNGALNSDIYAQRINSTGAAQWTADGVVISVALNNQLRPQLIADGAGGAIIVWQDTRVNSNNDDIYAQRINSAGAVQWTVDGVPISILNPSDQQTPQLVPDGAGGAIIVWQDYRSGATPDIYAQRIDSAGAAQWTADGVVVSAAADNQSFPQLIPDNAGGAIIVWQDRRNAANYDVYAQRVNSAGAAQWTADGVAVSAAAGNQQTPQLCPDNAGGAIIAWHDLRSGSNLDIYVQGITAGGRL